MPFTRRPPSKTAAKFDAAKRRGQKSKAPPALVPTKPAVKAPAAHLKMSAPMRTLVDRRVNKHLETKELRYMLWEPTSGAGSTAYTLRNAISELSIKPLLCPINQGDSDETPLANSPFRMGNAIHPVSLQVRVKLYIKSDETPQGSGSADRGAMQPYLFVGHNKNIRNNVQLVEDNYGTTVPFFWRGSSQESTQENPSEAGITQNFTGERQQFVVGRLNTTLLRPIKGGVKSPVITREVGYYQNPVASEGGGGFSNKHVERNYIFNVPVPKKLRYSSNDDKFPDNFAPFLACGFTYVGGADASTQAPLRIETNVTFRYKDA